MQKLYMQDDNASIKQVDILVSFIPMLKYKGLRLIYRRKPCHIIVSFIISLGVKERIR